MNNTPKTHVTIYTDDGCEPNPGVGGWAARLIFDDRQQELSGGDRDNKVLSE
jgi:ribonuclease HI